MTYYVITSRSEARRGVGKLVSSFGSFGPHYPTADAARAAVVTEPWFDDHDPTTVVCVDIVPTGPRSIRFRLTVPANSESRG